MTDKTLQERLRDPEHGFDRNESHSEDRYVCLCEHLANEAADALDAQAERIKDLEDTERAYEELSQYLVGDKMIAPIAGVIALETRIKALEGALRDAKTILDDVLLDYNEATRNKWRRTAHAWDGRARALLGEK